MAGNMEEISLEPLEQLLGLLLVLLSGIALGIFRDFPASLQNLKKFAATFLGFRHSGRSDCSVVLSGLTLG